MEPPHASSIHGLPMIETTRLVEGLLPSPSHSLVGGGGWAGGPEEGGEQAGLQSSWARARPAITLLLAVVVLAVLGCFLISIYQAELLRWVGGGPE